MCKTTGSSLILLTFVMFLVGCEKTSPEVIGNYSSTSAISSAESTSQNTQHHQFGKNNNSTMVSFGFNSSTMSHEATQELKKQFNNSNQNHRKALLKITGPRGTIMAFSKKYCPIWIYDCVVAQSVNDFILYGVDLAQPCRKFAGGLTGIFEEISLEELVRSSELVVQFLIEEKINEDSIDLLSNFSYYRFHYASKETRRKFGGIFGSKLSDGVREYSGNQTLKSLKAYYYEARSDVAVVGSPGWSLATQTELPDLQEIARNSSFQINPMIYLEQ